MNDVQLFQLVQRYRREYAVDRYGEVVADLCLELLKIHGNVIDEISKGHRDAYELAANIAKIVRLDVPTVMQYLEEQ